MLLPVKPGPALKDLGLAPSRFYIQLPIFKQKFGSKYQLPFVLRMNIKNKGTALFSSERKKP